MPQAIKSPQSKTSPQAPVSSAAVPTFETIDLPEILWLPLCSRANAQIKPKPAGHVVEAGDPLVENAPESSHVAIAPVAGIIGTSCEVQLVGGETVPAVELKVDREKTGAMPPSNKALPASGSLVSGIERLRSAGVWALRHISPDLIGQLNQIISRPIDTIICTSLDVDGSLRLNAAIAAQSSDLVTSGLALLTRLTNAHKCVIAVEAALPPRWLSPLRAAARAARISVMELPNDYPQSDPTLMVYTIARRRMRPGQSPAALGVLVLDTVAALAVGRAARGEPASHTPLALRNHLPNRSHFLNVPIGTRVKDILHHLKISESQMTLRCGDLLRDLPLSGEAVIGGTELTIHVTPPELPSKPEPCIRCGWCREICPTGVYPAMILDATQRGDPATASAAGIRACIDCGLCAHVCPSRLPLLAAIRQMRTLI